MSRSRPSKLRSHGECLALVGDLVAGTHEAHEAALAVLRREVGAYVACFAALPFDWLQDTKQTRRAIAERVFARIAADRYRLLRDWRYRAVRCKDHARFWTMVRTVLWFEAIEVGRASRRDL